jgi:hypothetical protein
LQFDTENARQLIWAPTLIKVSVQTLPPGAVPAILEMYWRTSSAHWTPTAGFSAGNCSGKTKLSNGGLPPVECTAISIPRRFHSRVARNWRMFVCNYIYVCFFCRPAGQARIRASPPATV